MAGAGHKPDFVAAENSAAAVICLTA